MTFTEFESIVRSERKDIFSISQKSKTQNTGVMVTFSEGGKAYIYKGSYQAILQKLGINKMGKQVKLETLINLRAQLDYAIKTHNTISIFTGNVRDNSQEIADLKRRIAAVESM